MNKRGGRLVGFCYLVCVCGWLLVQLCLFWYDRAQPTTVLDLDTLEYVDMEQTEAGVWLTTSGDPQIHITGIEGGVRRVALCARFSSITGEMDMYYARKEGQGPAPSRRVWGHLQQSGIYLYTLPPGSVTSLRLDPGTFADNEVTIDTIVINPRMPLASYILPGFAGWLALAIVPPLVACGISALGEAWALAKRGRPGARGSAGTKPKNKGEQNGR